MAVSLPTINSERWNRLCDSLAGKVQAEFSRRTVPNTWRHPWNCLARWNPFLDAWEINIQAGFVNAAETEGPSLAAADAPADTRARLEVDGAALVRPWLSENPWFPVRPELWRAIGSDAAAGADGETVPEWFQALGVGGPPSLSINPDLSGVTTAPGGFSGRPSERRLLRAVDVVLAVPKPAPGFALSTEGGLDYADPNLIPPAGLPSVGFRRRWTPPAAAPTLLEQLATGLGEPPVAEYRVATVYLLSPPGAADGGAPGADWVPYVAGVLFWNLCFAWVADLSAVPRFRVSLSTGLAGGVADGIVAAMLAPNNEADAAAALALSRTRVQAEAWTV